MLDIDGFKEINDRQGQIQGDRVLAAVGEALRSVARRYDTVGRFAGDAFVIVLPETEARSHRHLAERFQAALRSTVADATSVAVEASVGVVEWDRESSAGHLLEAAERSMRNAKARGRGRVEAQPAADRADGLSELARHFERKRGSGADL
jgi:diguanylate cyclase (GGDEF)-like protein